MGIPTSFIFWQVLIASKHAVLMGEDDCLPSRLVSRNPLARDSDETTAHSPGIVRGKDKTLVNYKRGSSLGGNFWTKGFASQPEAIWNHKTLVESSYSHRVVSRQHNTVL